MATIENKNLNPNGLTAKEASMASSSLSLSSIISSYSDRSVWELGVCSITLRDGTRLVETALGDGFRIYRKGMGLPVYVPFA